MRLSTIKVKLVKDRAFVSRGILLLFVVVFMVIGPVGAANMNLRWEYSIGSRVRYVFVDDLDSDGVKELVLVSGDTLYVLGANGRLKWKKDIGSIVSICISDLEGDGQKEIIVSSGETLENIARGNIRIFENNGEMRWIFPPGRVKSNKIMHEIKAVDMDDNGYKEIVGGTRQGIATLADNYNKYLWYLSLNDSIKAVSTEPEGWILANSDYSVYAVGFDGSVEWNRSIADGVSSLELTNIYPGAGEEIFIVSLEGGIYILNSEGEVKEKINISKEDFSAIPLNLDDDDYDEILLTSKDVTYALDTDNEIMWVYNPGERIKGVIVSDIEGKGEESILLFSDRYLYSVNRDGELEHIYDPGLEHSINNILVDDFENDGEPESIIFSLDRVYIFNINWSQVKKEEAEEYYRRADEYLTTGDYENATTYLQKAKRTYVELNDKENILRCSITAAKIAAGIKNEKRTLAENYYRLAEHYYTNTLYENANNYIMNATRLYIELRDGKGVAKCSVLARRITDAIKSITTSICPSMSTTSTLSETTILTTIPSEGIVPGEIVDKISGMVAVLIGVLVIIFINRWGKTKEE